MEEKRHINARTQISNSPRSFKSLFNSFKVTTSSKIYNNNQKVHYSAG